MKKGRGYIYFIRVIGVFVLFFAFLLSACNFSFSGDMDKLYKQMSSDAYKILELNQKNTDEYVSICYKYSDYSLGVDIVTDTPLQHALHKYFANGMISMQEADAQTFSDALDYYLEYTLYNLASDSLILNEIRTNLTILSFGTKKQAKEFFAHEYCDYLFRDNAEVALYDNKVVSIKGKLNYDISELKTESGEFIPNLSDYLATA